MMPLKHWQTVAVVGLFLVVLAFSFGSVHLVPLEVLLLAVISPFGEELAYRGFAFGFLRRIAGWGFWPAALAPAVIFAIGPIVQADDLTVLLIRLLLTVGGAVLFAWLFEKWGSLWMPFALHGLMNFAWQVFAVEDSAYAETLSIVMQLVTVAIAMVVTVFRSRLPLAKPASEAAP